MTKAVYTVTIECDDDGDTIPEAVIGAIEDSQFPDDVNIDIKKVGRYE